MMMPQEKKRLKRRVSLECPEDGCWRIEGMYLTLQRGSGFANVSGSGIAKPRSCFMN
ncbi:hypothetical protein AGR1B_Cc130064 [Agrobacterium fabacearum S56]|nr:hypothetical protein AGR1B_Cc130064 [Agrobacterium fabacearum S56]